MSHYPLKLALAVSLALAGSARGHIEAPYTLAKIVSESSNVVLVEVQKVQTDKNLVIFKKVRDLKGKFPEALIRQNIGQRGDAGDWQAVMTWVKAGKKAVFFSKDNASLTCIDRHWYQCFKEDQWWAMSHAEPYLVRAYHGGVDKLIAALDKMLAGKEVIIPCLADGTKDQLKQRKLRLQLMKASMKRIEYDAKRDFVAFTEDRPDAPKNPAVARPKAPPARASAKKFVPGQGKPNPLLVVDKKGRTVTVPCRVAPRKVPYLAEVYPIEVAATYPGPRGQKAHETVVVFKKIRPSEVHAALVQLGLKPGKPSAREEVKGSGPEVKVLLEVADANGKPVRLPLEQFLVNRQSGKPLPALKWYFTGSVLREPNPEKDEVVYGADLTGTLVTLFSVTDDTVIQSSLTTKEAPGLKVETDKKKLPGEGKPAKLIVQVK